MRIEVLALKGLFTTHIYRHPQVKDLCLKILQEAMDFWDAYVPMFTSFYTKFLPKVCDGGKCSKVLQQACWVVTTGALEVMLNEVHAVRVHATSAHLMQGPDGMGMFFHATLQELRVLRDY